MRAPLLALAALCLVVTGYFLVTKLTAIKPSQQIIKRNLPVIQKTVPVADSVNVVAQSVRKAIVQPKKQPVYSACNIAFIQPVPLQMALLTGVADTIVRFRQGTQITVNASDFVNERTGQLIAGPVRLQVDEYYNMEDILLHDLSTATKDGLLETNGMINLQAFAANGEGCKLKKDGTLRIHFPLKNDKKDMELFSGIPKSDGTIIWQPLLLNATIIRSTTTESSEQKPVTNSKVMVDTSLNTIPVFTGGMSGVEKNINSVKNPFPIKNTNAMVIADFNVDKDGSVCWVKIINGKDDDYNRAVSNALYKMKDWKPALKKGKEMLMTMRLAVSFNVTNPRLLRFWSCVKSPDQTNFRVDNRYENRSWGNGWEYGQDSYTGSLLNYYAFTTSSLGWINCDRFYNSTAPQTQLFVAEPVDNNTSIKMVFHTIKSVLNAAVTDGRYCFEKVPKGQAVTIVALKGKKGNLQMAVKTMNVSDAVVSGLKFKNVTPEDIKTTMRQFNKLSEAVVKN